MNNDLPFPRAYWVIPGRLLAGNYPGDPDPSIQSIKLNGLLDVGVQLIINLLNPDENGSNGKPFQSYEAEIKKLAQNRNQEIECKHFPIKDFSTPTPLQMRLILDTIDQGLANGKIVYVHCWGGLGRTGTVIGCFLSRHGLASGTGTITKIAELRQGMPGSEYNSPETTAQEVMMMSWVEGH